MRPRGWAQTLGFILTFTFFRGMMDTKVWQRWRKKVEEKKKGKVSPCLPTFSWNLLSNRRLSEVLSSLYQIVELGLLLFQFPQDVLQIQKWNVKFERE